MSNAFAEVISEVFGKEGEGREATKQTLAQRLHDMTEGVDLALCRSAVDLLEKVLSDGVPPEAPKAAPKPKALCRNCKQELQEGWNACPFCKTDVAAPKAASSSGRQAGETAVSQSGIKTAWIPAGTFAMGNLRNEMGRNDNEGPQRQVTISRGFWMGVYPVTQEEWERVMGGNPSSFSKNPAAGETQGKRPVENVNWYDAIEFANWLSMMEGLKPAYRIKGITNPDGWGREPKWEALDIVDGADGWRLPTEAQWEYAARAGTTTAFSNGATDWQNKASIDSIGWFEFNSAKMTHEAGCKQPNPWGLYDMHGNVWEWVWDWYSDYPVRAQTDPDGAHSGALRVSRGGSWYISAVFARSAVRFGDVPSMQDGNLGLRLARP
ncbi:MAG: formylglycine-generating enzyme family protein [Spirochaetes bacterium]|nr:formylglycine-generating enzyme family protein [Spirochaetota bacterium]